MRANGISGGSAEQRLSMVIPAQQLLNLVGAIQAGGNGTVLVLGSEEMETLQENRSVTLRLKNGDCYVLIPQKLVEEAYGGAF